MLSLPLKILIFLSFSFALSACPFCDPKVLENQVFFETEHTLALIPYKPIMEGHALIIPKRHVAQFEELTEEEIKEIGITIKRVHQISLKLFHTPSYILHQKNGKEAGQSVFHLHFHYLPKQLSDSSYLKLLYRILLAHLKGPIPEEELKKTTQKLKEANG